MRETRAAYSTKGFFNKKTQKNRTTSTVEIKNFGANFDTATYNAIHDPLHYDKQPIWGVDEVWDQRVTKRFGGSGWSIIPHSA